MRGDKSINDYDFLNGVSVNYKNKLYIIDGSWQGEYTGEIYISLKKEKTYLNVKANEVIKIIDEDIT